MNGPYDGFYAQLARFCCIKNANILMIIVFILSGGFIVVAWKPLKQNVQVSPGSTARVRSKLLKFLYGKP